MEETLLKKYAHFLEERRDILLFVAAAIFAVGSVSWLAMVYTRPVQKQVQEHPTTLSDEDKHRILESIAQQKSQQAAPVLSDSEKIETLAKISASSKSTNTASGPAITSSGGSQQAPALSNEEKIRLLENLH